MQRRLWSPWSSSLRGILPSTRGGRHLRNLGFRRGWGRIDCFSILPHPHFEENHDIPEISRVPESKSYVPVSRKGIADEEIGNIRIRPSFPRVRLRNFSRPGRRPENFGEIPFMKCTIDFSPSPLAPGQSVRPTTSWEGEKFRRDSEDFLGARVERCI